MCKNKYAGRNNLCGENICKLCLSFPTKLSQRGLADKMQLIGIRTPSSGSRAASVL